MDAQKSGWERKFCAQNQISPSAMDMIHGMRRQILGQLQSSRFVPHSGQGLNLRELNVNSNHWSVVKAALTAGSYPNIARFDTEGSQLRTMKESKVRFHPGSEVVGQETGSSKHKVTALF
jgi:HrpA-like RNA helicase